MRRPQRPGNQFRAETLSGRTLPAIHPRELPGTVGSAGVAAPEKEDLGRCSDGTRDHDVRHVHAGDTAPAILASDHQVSIAPHPARHRRTVPSEEVERRCKS